MRRRRGLATLALLTLWACDSEGLAPGTETSLSLRVETVAGFSSSADAGVVHLEGPSSRTINIQPGETRTIDGLAPGTYTVALEALLQGRLESFDQTTVTVIAGQNRQANLVLDSFLTGFASVPQTATAGTSFTVQLDAVTGAAAYVVELADNPGFTNAQTVEDTDRTLSITLEAPGTWHLRAFARDRFGTDGVRSAASTVSVEVAGQPRVVVGDEPSSTIDVGDQLPLPVLLDLSGSGGLEVAKIEILLGFDSQLFGVDSWSFATGAFQILEEEKLLDSGLRIVRLVLQRNADFASSATLGVLTLDAAAVGVAAVAVVVASAEEPDGTSIAGETFEEVGHGVTIQQGNPVVRTLQPGEQAANLAGGVLYYRVPVPSAGASAPGRTDLGPIVIPGGKGVPHGRAGSAIGDREDTFESAARLLELDAGSAHVRLLGRYLGDAPDRGAVAAAAQTSGRTLRIQISGGTGDADLYTRFGELPTVNTWDCRPFLETNDEHCDAVDPQGGDWFVMIRPWGVQNAFTGLTLQAALFDAVSIVTPDLPIGVVGTPYQMSLAAADGDGTYEWSVASGDLPPGIGLASDGTLSGTPSAAGDYTFTLEVASASKSAQAQLTLGVATTATPFAYLSVRNSTNIHDVAVTNLGGGGLETTRLETGSYRIVFPGIGLETLGAHFTGYVTTLASTSNASLSAPDPTCSLASLTASHPFTAVVQCNDVVTGDPMDTRFRLMVVADNVLGGTGAPGQSAAFSVHTRGPTPSYTPNPNFSWNSGGAAQTVTYQGSGVVRHTTGVTISTPYSVMVTSLAEHSCYASNGTSNFIDVLCRLRDGTATDQRNHLAMQIQGGRPGQPFAWALVQNSALTATYSRNDAGTIDVTPQGTGKWKITFNGLTLTDVPAVDVTPVSAGPWVYCSQFLSGVSPAAIDVACYDTSGSFVDTGFFVTVLQ